MACSVPCIAFSISTGPNKQSRVLEQIQTVPLHSKLYVHCDGPRDRTERTDAERVGEVRSDQMRLSGQILGDTPVYLPLPAGQRRDCEKAYTAR
jgi:hypothetical protein